MEHISCGKCSTVNQVPYGLEQFRCHTCRCLVSIAREPSAACAAASTSAQYLEGNAASGTVSAAPPAAERKGSGSSGGGGFFGNLQKKMQKVVRSFESGIDGGSKPDPTPTTFDPPKRLAPQLTAEEEQLQWALNASLEEVSRQHGAPPAQEVEDPSSAPAAVNSAAGNDMQAAAARAARRLRAAEDRAKRAEDNLAALQARERAAAEERAALKHQLEDNEGLIKGLTEQLDVVNGKLSKQLQRCTALEKALAAAQQAAVAARTGEAGEAGFEAEEAEMEYRGTIAQLLARIAELEGTLLRATHFAPQVDEEPDTPEASAVEAAAGAAEPAECAKKLPQPASALDRGCAAADPDVPDSPDEPDLGQRAAAPEVAKAAEASAAQSATRADGLAEREAPPVPGEVVGPVVEEGADIAPPAEAPAAAGAPCEGAAAAKAEAEDAPVEAEASAPPVVGQARASEGEGAEARWVAGPSTAAEGWQHEAPAATDASAEAGATAPSEAAGESPPATPAAGLAGEAVAEAVLAEAVATAPAAASRHGTSEGEARQVRPALEPPAATG
eukprot:CAMPEP_0175785272 /NCGR_PEP_ID=MMETSP0097-20121207/79242_1 /TAXON_ID=311494 /ORGANISM="Alexandrium monilatum, Strain CCMP3105" /LENGTH=558 /DNA_ID=CAMNT_0017096177 /DNA_START=12 /DNA_END=1688 /DNA_ORIENTATION=-